MSDDERKTMSVESMQTAITLARRNVERLKAQATAPELPPLRKAHRGHRGGRRNLTPKSQATLVHTLGGSALFVKPPSLIDSVERQET